MAKPRRRKIGGAFAKRKTVIAKRPGAFLESEGGAQFLAMKKTEQRKLWMEGMQEACFVFVTKFLPLRFTNYIMRPPWNYRPKRNRNDRDPRPLVSDGTLRSVVENGTDVKVTGSARDGSSGKITIPVLPYTGQKHKNILETVADWEAQAMANALERALVDQMEARSG